MSKIPPPGGKYRLDDGHNPKPIPGIDGHGFRKYTVDGKPMDVENGKAIDAFPPQPGVIEGIAESSAQISKDLGNLLGQSPQASDTKGDDPIPSPTESDEPLPPIDHLTW